MPEITSVTIRYRVELEDFTVNVSETYRPKRKPKREPEKKRPNLRRGPSASGCPERAAKFSDKAARPGFRHALYQPTSNASPNEKETQNTRGLFRAIRSLRAPQEATLAICDNANDGQRNPLPQALD